MRAQELEWVLVLVLVLALVLDSVLDSVLELHTQPDCLPVSLLILGQILVSCSIHPPFIKY